MGSSKKKKDKDGKKNKREKRDRDSDGSKRSRDRKSKDYDRENKRRREDEDTGEDDELLTHALHSQEEEYISSEKEKKSSNEESMSVGETNKIREKLGLKPLAVENQGENKPDEFVHAPAVNIMEKEMQEKYKEKIKEMREKREMHKKLQNIKKLGESDSDDNDDSALSWVKKNRKQDQQKLMAEKRAKLLEEMDEEFGVGEMVDNIMGKPKGYTSHDLRGLTVEHSANMIKEGKQVVLTLKDSGVLDNEDDVLVNVNIIDTEKAEKNVELRKKKPGYQAYEEFDETGKQKVQGLLSKYDDEIEGEKKKTFILSQDGGANPTKEEELQNIRNRLQNHAVSLTMPELKPANEYYTNEEMFKFKKPKKRRKIKKRETLKAGDLIPLQSESSDHGSRISRGRTEKEKKNIPESLKDELMEWQMGDPDDAEIQGPEIDENEPLFEEDDAQLELQLALERSRRSKLKKESIGPEKLLDTLKTISEQTKKASENEGAIVLNSTSEFCRTLGEIPTYGSSGNRTEVNEMEDEDMETENVEDEHGGWEVVKHEAKKLKQFDEEPLKQESNVLDDEPVLGMGIGTALQMIHKKGLIEEDKVKENKFAGGLSLPETVKIIDEEKMRDEERDRMRDRGRDRDRDRYNPNAFKEKVGYRPDVKLEYVDRNGRHLNPKEAFRDLSHKFHGKIPGKLKTEKREKKVSEELALKKMNAGDTPLNTVALFSEKQKQGQTPYLILSGGGQTFSSGTTIRKSK